MSILVNFVTWSPLISIMFFSLAITAGLVALYKKLIPKEKFESLKQRQKELRKRMAECKPEKLAELQKEMLQCSIESMRLTFKPMIITFIPLLFIFWGLKKLYVDFANIGNIISWPWNLPIVGNGAGWLLCYVMFSLIFSFALRKAFKF